MSTYPIVLNFPLGHDSIGVRPLYVAARLMQTNVVAVLIELGTDPLHPVEHTENFLGYISSQLSLAAMGSPRVTKMLL